VTGLAPGNIGRLADGRQLIETSLDSGRGLRLNDIELGGAMTTPHTRDGAGRSANIGLGVHRAEPQCGLAQ
jgi:uncharacterized protein YdiU (UPF0061 family)